MTEEKRGEIAGVLKPGLEVSEHGITGRVVIGASEHGIPRINIDEERLANMRSVSVKFPAQDGESIEALAGKPVWVDVSYQGSAYTLPEIDNLGFVSEQEVLDAVQISEIEDFDQLQDELVGVIVQRNPIFERVIPLIFADPTLHVYKGGANSQGKRRRDIYKELLSQSAREGYDQKLSDGNTMHIQGYYERNPALTKDEIDDILDGFIPRLAVRQVSYEFMPVFISNEIRSAIEAKIR